MPFTKTARFFLLYITIATSAIYAQRVEITKEVFIDIPAYMVANLQNIAEKNPQEALNKLLQKRPKDFMFKNESKAEQEAVTKSVEQVILEVCKENKVFKDTYIKKILSKHVSKNFIGWYGIGNTISIPSKIIKKKQLLVAIKTTVDVNKDKIKKHVLSYVENGETRHRITFHLNPLKNAKSDLQKAAQFIDKYFNRYFIAEQLHSRVATKNKIILELKFVIPLQLKFLKASVGGTQLQFRLLASNKCGGLILEEEKKKYQIAKEHSKQALKKYKTELLAKGFRWLPSQNEELEYLIWFKDDYNITIACFASIEKMYKYSTHMIATLKKAYVVKFAEMTERYIDERMAIIKDGKVMLAPVIKDKIANGKVVLDNLFKQEANFLQIALEVHSSGVKIEFFHETIATAKSSNR